MHSDQEERLFGALKRIQDTATENGKKLDELLATLAEMKDPGYRYFDNQTGAEMKGDEPMPETGFTMVLPNQSAGRIGELEKVLNSKDYEQGKVSAEIKPDGTVVTAPADPGPQAKEDETGVGDATEESEAKHTSLATGAEPPADAPYEDPRRAVKKP